MVRERSIHFICSSVLVKVSAIAQLTRPLMPFVPIIAAGCRQGLRAHPFLAQPRGADGEQHAAREGRCRREMVRADCYSECPQSQLLPLSAGEP